MLGILITLAKLPDFNSCQFHQKIIFLLLVKNKIHLHEGYHSYKKFLSQQYLQIVFQGMLINTLRR